MEFLPETICSLPDIKLLPAFPIFSRVFVQGEPDYNRTDKSSGGIEMTGPAAPKDPEKARPFFYIKKTKIFLENGKRTEPESSLSMKATDG